MKSVITWEIERNIQFTHLQRKRYDTSCLLGLHYYSHYVSFQINAPPAPTVTATETAAAAVAMSGE